MSAKAYPLFYFYTPTKIHKVLNMPSAVQLKCPPIPHVRIALIGLGDRGMKTLERYAYIKGAEFKYIVDLHQERLDKANQMLQAQGRPVAKTLQGVEAWKEVCDYKDIDLLYICTEWSSHTPIAVHAMKCGKHVAVEVPAATTIDECWQLVRTAEETQRHLFMTENCCYDLFALETLQMHQQGLFGKITHCEGAYIHHLGTASDMDDCGKKDTHHNWMLQSCAQHGGNPYPTHGIGPIAQLLDFHNSDRMVSLTSITSKGVENKESGACVGKINNSLIQTANGVSILLQLDVTTPRPYSRMQTICGTKGYAQKYPIATVQTETNSAVCGEDANQLLEKFATTPAALLWKEGSELGVKNAMNFAMDSRFITCLQQGLPLDMDVYDAAEWSCLAELTQISAKNGGIAVEIPKFRP